MKGKATMSNQLTILQACSHEIIIEKSRFICTLTKVRTEAEAQDSVKKLKKHYWDATHNCSAYIIDATLQRSSDDGEPSGTAGLPMLEVLRKQQLVQVSAVVTRYFGGIKLGAGGLVRAYTTSVVEALKVAGLARLVPMGVYGFAWPLEDVGRVVNLLYQQNIFQVQDIIYANRAQVQLRLPQERQAEAEAWLTEALSRSIELEEITVSVVEQAVDGA